MQQTVNQENVLVWVFTGRVTFLNEAKFINRETSAHVDMQFLGLNKYVRMYNINM